MNTYYLGEQQILAYVRDFLRRVTDLDPVPEVWCPITRSGGEILKSLLGVVRNRHPELLARVKILPIEVSKTSKRTKVKFVGDDRPEKLIPNKAVLLLDGAIHSGRTMAECAAAVLTHRPKELSSYSLVIKASSSFIPTMWGVTIAETDRAFFLLDEIPNHRLDAGAGDDKKRVQVNLERLDKRHLQKPRVLCGVASMDRAKWSDRHYQMTANETPPCTYVLLRGKVIVGYLTIHFAASGRMVIDEVAVGKNQKGRGYGGVLMRFGDTLARHVNCSTIRLNAIHDQVGFYRRLGYRKVAGRSSIQLDQETYWPMERPVLYHQRLANM